MSQLVIVGTLAFDAIETPFGKTNKILGGAATFIGLAATNYNIEGAIVSVVGGDFPQDYINILKNKGINCSGIEVVQNGKTFYWSGKYHNDMNTRDTLVTELNVLADFEPVVPKKYRNSEVVLLGNLHPHVQMSVVSQITAAKLVVLDTMNFWIDQTWEALHEVLAKVDVICINDEEARQLSGEYSLVRAAEKIQTMGPKYVIIKKGEHGALLFHKQEVFFTPALPLEKVIDPTGAGDTFAGGFVGYLTQTQDYSFHNMKKAIVHGSVLASFCVEQFGTERLQNLKREEIITRMKKFKQLSQVDIEV